MSTHSEPVNYHVGRLPSINAALDVNRPSFDTFAHWRYAQNGRIDGTFDHASRDDLRAKARYEFQNNSSFNGLVTSLALSVVGTGAKLSFNVDHLIPNRSDNSINQLAREFSGKVERQFNKWSKDTKLFIEQYISIISMVLDGEALATIQYHPNSPQCP